MMPDFDRPIILLGPTRSGKSLCAKILAATGSYSILREPIMIWDIGRPWLGAADDCRSGREAKPAVVRRIRHALSAAHEVARSERFVDDLPHHVFRLDFVRAVLPEARFIVVLRDPRPTLAAMKKGWLKQENVGRMVRRKTKHGRHRLIQFSRVPATAALWAVNKVRQRLGLRKASWGPTAPGQRDFAKTHRLTQTVAYQWSQMGHYSLRAIEQLPPHHLVTVRYEDLIARSNAALQSLAAITAIPIEVVAEAADGVIELTRDESGLLLPDDEWRSIEPIIAPVRQAMGYAPDASTPN